MILEYAASNQRELPPDTILYRARIYTEDDGRYKTENVPDGKFKGYDEENSFVNKNNNSIFDGRNNPALISYLYAANSIDTCIAEVKPNLRDLVSVAEIKTLGTLRMVNLFTRKYAEGSCKYLVEFVMGLSSEFNMIYKQPGDYLFTQYVSELLKNTGYDGVIYSSPGNQLNYTIFNYEKCAAINSKLYLVRNTKVEFVCAQPLKM